jgi:hypothetical protein
MIDGKTNGDRGRKFQAQRDALVTLTVGTIALAAMGADAATQAGFVTGVVGITGGFMWGNARVHTAQASNGQNTSTN